ncbi:MAG: NAD(+) diphosphatase [Clostridiales bacterium]|nr:NAD(+) diphosphatase [Candidatus Blautia equi]
MIQDIGKGRYKNEYRPRAARAEDPVICCKGREFLIRVKDREIFFPTYGEVTEKIPALKGQETYLFEIEGTYYFLFRGGAGGFDDPTSVIEEAQLPGYEWSGFRKLRDTNPGTALFAGVTGAQLSEWYKNRKFCPHCGTPMVHSEKERMMQCPSCKLMEYPKISPAVIVAVTNGDHILLTKYAGRGFTNYALIAGFNEIGESIEDTVHREVLEEVGVKVKNLRFYKSQPWSVTDTLLFGFFCELDGSDTITLDQEELAVGEWVNWKDVPENDGISLTREMMNLFKEQKRQEKEQA